MKFGKLYIYLISFFALANMASCVSVPEPEQTSAPSLEATQKIRKNVARFGTASASVESYLAHMAIDGDPDSVWLSQHFAPHWFLVELDDFYLVDKIELVVTQHVPGPTTHEVWLGSDSGNTVPYKSFVDVQTEDGQTLEVIIDPPQKINEVYVLTRKSQGWVAWREVRVLGTVDSNIWHLVEVVSGLEFPVQVTHAGDNSCRLFVVERKGRIRIIEDGNVKNGPFLDISERVRCCEAEQGLFNIAFPPNYVEQRHFYISYTNVEGSTVISRFRTTANLDVSDPDSEEILLVLPQPTEIHNGGRMVFGPKDGYLYIGSGDGGGEGQYSAQDPGSLLGKILRIDVESGVKPYDIPTSNPFAQVDGYRAEIWTLGLRNPWGFAFDRGTGDIYITDTGNAKREEVNYQPASSSGGENYGWHVWEGNYCLETPGLSCGSVEAVLPVATYDHSQGCAIVGGAVYQDIFFYADFCRGRVWGLQKNEEVWESRLIIDGSTAISSIGKDEAGNVYATGYANGVIYIIEAVR